MANMATKRVKKDLAEFFRDPLDLVYLFPDENNIQGGYALVVGPEKTPYEKGLFLFSYKVPDTYPTNPPRVTFLTTGRRQRVRFNPNLYSCGKVCLSILGTWKGPAWAPCNTLATVFLSIQSLLTEAPIRNEPGYEKTDLKSDQSIKYNELITYRTFRHAVLEQADPSYRQPTEQISTVIAQLFFKHESFYREMMAKKKADTAVNDVAYSDHFAQYQLNGKTKLNYAEMEGEFDALKKRLLEKYPDGKVETTDYDQTKNAFAKSALSVPRPVEEPDSDFLQKAYEETSEFFMEDDDEEDEDGELYEEEEDEEDDDSEVELLADSGTDEGVVSPKETDVVDIQSSDDESEKTLREMTRLPAANGNAAREVITVDSDDSTGNYATTKSPLRNSSASPIEVSLSSHSSASSTGVGLMNGNRSRSRSPI